MQYLTQALGLRVLFLSSKSILSIFKKTYGTLDAKNDKLGKTIFRGHFVLCGHSEAMHLSYKANKIIQFKCWTYQREGPIELQTSIIKLTWPHIGGPYERIAMYIQYVVMGTNLVCVLRLHGVDGLPD